MFDNILLLTTIMRTYQLIIVLHDCLAKMNHHHQNLAQLPAHQQTKRTYLCSSTGLIINFPDYRGNAKLLNLISVCRGPSTNYVIEPPPKFADINKCPEKFNKKKGETPSVRVRGCDLFPAKR